MPWEIIETNGNYCVHKEGEGEALKCYPDKDAATEYMRALYASEKALEEGAEFSVAGKAVLVGERGPEPLYISHDRMKTWTAGSVSSVDVTKAGTTVTVDIPAQPVGNKPNLLDKIAQGVKNALQRGNNDIIAFKVNTSTRSWVGIWTNNFEDREKEIFSSKSINDYIARVDMGIIPPPELWIWHTPGSRIGQAKQVALVGAFVLSAGNFDETPIAEKAMHRLAKTKRLKMSHGFIYNPKYKVDGVYHQFNTFEISVLPGDKAANPYTSFEEIENMPFTPDKKAFFEEVLGADETGVLEKALDDNTAAIAARGVASKELFGDFASVADTEADSAESAKEAVETTTKALAPLLIDVLDAQAESASLETKLIGRIKELETQVSGFKAIVEQLQAAVDLKPRIAGDAKETVDKEATDAEKSLLKGSKIDPFWGTIVEKDR